MRNFITPFIARLNLSNLNNIFIIVLVVAILLGLGTGYLLTGSSETVVVPNIINESPQNAQQDNRTFRDFAEGMIQKRPESKQPQEYLEGTHFLIRDGAMPVALTSSVVDLTEYEGKKVKIFGETQKAIKEGWLMDVGKVEVAK